MEYKSRVIINYVTKETQVIYTHTGIHKLKSVFNNKVISGSNWIEIESTCIQLDKIISIEFLEN